MSGSTLCIYWGLQTTIEAESQTKVLGEKLNIRTRNKHELLRGLVNASAVDIVLKSMEIPFVNIFYFFHLLIM